MDDSRIKDAASLLRAFFDNEKLRQGGQYAEFSASWKNIVGDRAAAHSHVADVERGNLVVEAEHPGWIQILQLRQREILEAVRQRFPELNLRGIVFRLGKAGAGNLAPGGKVARPGPFGPEGKGIIEEGEASPPEEAEAGRKPLPLTLDGIPDSELKRSLEELKKAMDGKDQ